MVSADGLFALADALTSHKELNRSPADANLEDVLDDGREGSSTRTKASFSSITCGT
jgi:hypothetical protein